MQLASLIAGTVTALLYIILLFMVCKKKDYILLIQNLDEKKYFMKGIYPVGFWLLDVIHYPYTGKLDTKRFRQCQVLYAQFGEYYFRLNYAQKVSIVLLLLPLTLLAAGMAGQGMVLVFGILVMVCGYWYYDMVITDEIKKRKDEISKELAGILSELALLVSAGMILQKAWDTVSIAGEGTLYNEMRRVKEERENGISYYDALQNFAVRCDNKEVNKFISTMLQNMEKGNRELVYYLKLQAAESWEERKHAVRRQGEAASSHLMVPVGIMLVGIILMVMVPVMSGFSFI